MASNPQLKPRPTDFAGHVSVHAIGDRQQSVEVPGIMRNSPLLLPRLSLSTSESFKWWLAPTALAATKRTCARFCKHACCLERRGHRNIFALGNWDSYLRKVAISYPQLQLLQVYRGVQLAKALRFEMSCNGRGTQASTSACFVSRPVDRGNAGRGCAAVTWMAHWRRPPGIGSALGALSWLRALKLACPWIATPCRATPHF